MTEATQAPYRAESLPTKIGLVVFPGFQPLDAFGPFDTLTMLSCTHKLELAIIGPTLEPTTTAFSDPKYNIAGSVDFGARIVPTHTYDTAPEDIDVLFVPGGIGCLYPEIERTVAYVARAYPKLKYLVTVCNGAGIAAAAGVLDGKRATTNKLGFYPTAALGPKVQWVRSARYVVDGNCWTSSGVSAGIDCTLAWIAHVWGREKAREISDGIEYEWKDDRHWDPFAYMTELKVYN